MEASEIGFLMNSLSKLLDISMFEPRHKYIRVGTLIYEIDSEK